MELRSTITAEEITYNVHTQRCVCVCVCMSLCIYIVCIVSVPMYLQWLRE